MAMALALMLTLTLLQCLFFCTDLDLSGCSYLSGCLCSHLHPLILHNSQLLHPLPPRLIYHCHTHASFPTPNSSIHPHTPTTHLHPPLTTTVTSTHHIQYYHSHTGQPLTHPELAHDSREEVDSEWLLQRSHRTLEEFDDVG